MSKQIGFFINFGVEARNFFCEAFSEIIKDSICIYTAYSKNLTDFSDKYHSKLVKIDKSIFKKAGRIEAIFLSVRNSRNRIKNINIHRHYSDAINKKTWKDFFKGNILIYTIFYILDKIVTHYSYTNKRVQTKLKSFNLDILFFSGYSSIESITMAVNAKKLGIKVILLISNWKDMYVNGSLHIEYDRIFMWSRNMLEMYKKINPFYSFSNTDIIGSPRLFSFENYKSKVSFIDFCNVLNIPNKSYILYTCANPKGISYEDLLVETIYKSMIELYGENAPSFVIKLNPMDSNQENWTHLSQKYKNISIILSDWEWNPSVDFNMPSLKSEEQWLDLLYHCSMTMNIASTVTLESLLMKKPVINIGFDYENKLNSEAIRYAQSPYYIDLLNRTDVYLSKNLDDCINTIHRFLSKKIEVKSIEEIVIPFNINFSTLL